MQEAEYQKQQTELEGKIAVAEMETKKKFQIQIHAQFGKLWTRITKKKMCVLKLNSMSLYLLLGKWHVTFLAFLGHRVKCERCYSTSSATRLNTPNNDIHRYFTVHSMESDLLCMQIVFFPLSELFTYPNTPPPKGVWISEAALYSYWVIIFCTVVLVCKSRELALITTV